MSAPTPIAGSPMLELLPDHHTLVAALATLFVTVDPLGLVPIFLSLTSSLSPSDRRHVAIWAFLISLAILIFFTLAGEVILNLLSIDLPAFRIAGGLLLFYTAFEMVFERRQARKEETAETAISRQELRNLAAFPLAIPLMAGPGAITACILLAAPMAGEPVKLAALIGVIALVCVTCLIVFLAAEPLNRLLGETARTVLSRLLGVILAALAVQFVADGVRSMMQAAG